MVLNIDEQYSDRCMISVNIIMLTESDPWNFELDLSELYI